MREREMLSAILQHALKAVSPETALLRHMHLEGDILHAGKDSWDLTGKQLYVVGAGKGAAPMALALENMLGERITKGLITVKYGHTLPLQHIRLYEAAHPVPDAAGVRAATAMLQIASHATASDIVIALLTGGASSLTTAPAAGLSLRDIQQVTIQLLRCGADIRQINVVRKHLSLFGGGQLARAAAPAHVLSVIVSDVVGDPLDVIASGPTYCDPSTFLDAIRILERFHLADKIPHAIQKHLEQGCAGTIEETPKPGSMIFNNVRNLLVATNRQALEAAEQYARQLGCSTEIVTGSLTGEAREQAVHLVRTAKKRAAGLNPENPPLCLLAGGETTVSLKGSGTGGRNQEMALAAAVELADTTGIFALFSGTDGTDGPTDAAGGFADGTTLSRIDHDHPGYAKMCLENNDSYSALHRARALFMTGPTLTNVMDLAVVLIFPSLRA